MLRMSGAMRIGMAGATPLVGQANGFLRGSGLVSAIGIIIIGVVMIAVSFLTSVGVGLLLVEVALGAGTLLAGALLLREATSKKQDQVLLSLWPGEIALAATFLYLGVTMPVFYQGLASYQNAAIQFSAVLFGLVFGACALALSGASKGIRRAGRIAPGASIRDGVILIVGTILLAIAFSQFAGTMLKPPQWNWISFLAITVPGMLLLVVREGVKEGSENWTGVWRVLGLVVTEVLLVGGLAIMLFGSYTNLTLGMNGFLVGFKGNAIGLTLWIAAALFLILVRGSFRLTSVQGRWQVSRRVINQVLYVVAVVAFIYGERSVLTGKAPSFSLGGAAPVAILILLGGLLVLVVARSVGLGRIVVQQADEDGR